MRNTLAVSSQSISGVMQLMIKSPFTTSWNKQRSAIFCSVADTKRYELILMLLIYCPVRSIARHAIHLQFNISANALEIRFTKQNTIQNDLLD
jgi:flagellar biosynthesis protein FlhB